MTNRIRDVNTRIDVDFKKFLDDIKIKRVKLDKDKKTLSDRRLTLAIARLPDIDIIKNFIINSDIKEDRSRG